MIIGITFWGKTYGDLIIFYKFAAILCLLILFVRMSNLVSVLRRMIRPVAIPLLIGLMLPMVSCRHTARGGHAGNAHYAQVDSLLKGIRDLDSLVAMVKTYHEDGDEVGEILALRYQGRRLRQLARFDEAFTVLQRGLDLATESKDTIEMALALTNIGDVNRRIGDMSTANGCYYKALHLLDGIGDQSCAKVMKADAAVLNGIGNVEIDLWNFTAADSVLRRALKIEEKMGSSLGVAVNYVDLGQVKSAQGDLDSAWYYYRKSMEYHQKAGSQKGIALCHLRYGELHEAENRFSHAIKEYNVAYDHLKGTGDTWQWLKPCLALARVHILVGEEELAAAYLNDAEREARRIGSKQFVSEADMIHYELSLLQGDTKKALQYYIDGNTLIDSIIGLKKSDEMRAQRIAYQNDRMSGEMDVLNNDIARLKRMRNTMALLVVLLLLMAGVIIGALVYAMRVRSRTQRMLRQVEKTRSLFFTNVVHQLRTPLTAIMGAIDGIIADSQNLANPNYTKSQVENVGIIERQGENLLDLVDRILEVGGVRSAISSLDWRTGDAVPFIRMVVESYRDQCLERHIELSYASRESSIEIDTVPDYLKTIMGSLLENAVNYSREFSKITVISWVEGKNFVIRVADTGIGINKTDLPHVFEPFYRGSEAEQIVDGVGIGLTVARDMVMAMGGSVAADSSKGQGSIFTVTLPCKHGNEVKMKFKSVAVKPRLLQRRQPSAVETSGQPVRGSQDKPAILIIEDHADVARLVGKVFKDKYAVYYAQDGAQGYAQAQELIPDLIVTDVKMPVMDGLELCRRVRSTSQLSHIPIIMLSARTNKEDRIRGIKAGADAYLIKPFVRDEMTAWADRLLASRRLPCGPGRSVESTSTDAAVKVSADYDDDNVFLNKFNQVVDKEFSRGVTKLDLDAIALKFKMGESQLRRRVQEASGKNVVAYVAQLRMEKAMRLLQEGPDDLLIGDVAEHCGFADVAYFSRVFRQHYGMTPTQARATRGDGVRNNG